MDETKKTDEGVDLNIPAEPTNEGAGSVKPVSDPMSEAQPETPAEDKPTV